MTIDTARVAELLTAAQEAVEQAGVSEALQEVAFGRAFDYLAYGGAAPAPPGASPRPEAPAVERPAPADGHGASRLDAIATKCRVEPELVREVFYEDGDNLAISIGAARFADEMRPAARQLALLVAAGRQAGGWDTDWTPMDEIRRVVTEFGRYDQANFATTIRGMTDVFGFSGSSRNRRVRVNRVGFERAGDLIRELTGGGSS